nr:ribonuclease H-like domain-containing protein [Tanacetum cinerariifolium]
MTVTLILASAETTDTASDGTSKKKGRTVTVTADDIQKRKNDVKARTTLLLSLSDEHQLQFSKYKTAQELWAAILKTFDEIELDDLNQKFLTSLAPEWLMHTIVWRSRSDLDTISLDDLYNHLKDVNQIDEDDMEEMDIKWNMALLSMRADKFWKKTGKKISIQGTDVAGFDKSKVECFNCHMMGHFARECRALRSKDRGRRDNYRQGSKFEEQAPKELMAIDGVGWDRSYMANDEENHALVADEEAPTEFALMANTSAKSKVFDNSLCFKDCKKNTDSLNRLAQVESRLVEHKEKEIKYYKNKEGLGYSAVPPPSAQIYSSPKKDISWTGLPEFKDDTVTDYSRPAPTVESSPYDAQNRNHSVTKASTSTISPKSFIKFVKENDSPTKSKIDKAEKAMKSPV